MTERLSDNRDKYAVSCHIIMIHWRSATGVHPFLTDDFNITSPKHWNIHSIPIYLDHATAGDGLEGMGSLG